jgi:hypothetical protein
MMTRCWPGQTKAMLMIPWPSLVPTSSQVQDVHSQEVRNMEQRGLDLKTKRNYRNRVKEIYTFFSPPDYAAYYNVGIQQLSAEEWTDPNLFYMT